MPLAVIDMFWFTLERVVFIVGTSTKEIEMQVSIEKITPKYAAKILEGNVDNRNLRKTHVDYLARQMAEGNFKTTHQGIAISTDGVLLDGQHRLHAVVKSGKTVEMYVFKDVDSKTFTAIDIGARRSNSDVTKIPKNATAIVEAIIRIKKNDKAFRANEKTSPDEMLEIYHQNSELFDFFGRPKRKSVLFAAGAMIAYLKSGEEIIKEQFVKFAYSEYTSMENSMLALCKKHEQRKLRTGGAADRAEIITNAFKHFLPENISKSSVRIDFDKTFEAMRKIIDDNFK